MRVGIAGFMHESNTFTAFPTTLDNFQIQRGNAVIDYYHPTFHEIAGFIKGAVAPRAVYEPVCKRIIEVDTIGAIIISIPKKHYHLARKTLYEWQGI